MCNIGKCMAKLTWYDNQNSNLYNKCYLGYQLPSYCSTITTAYEMGISTKEENKKKNDPQSLTQNNTKQATKPMPATCSHHPKISHILYMWFLLVRYGAASHSRRVNWHPCAHRSISWIVFGIATNERARYYYMAAAAAASLTIIFINNTKQTDKSNGDRIGTKTNFHNGRSINRYLRYYDAMYWNGVAGNGIIWD